MTRANFLQSITGCVAAAVSPERARGSEIQEIKPGARYVLTIPGFLREEDINSLQEQFRRVYPDLPPLMVLDGGATLSEIRPVGTADIEAAVERAIRKVAADNTGHAYIEAIPHGERGIHPLTGREIGETHRFFVGTGAGQRRLISRLEANELWPSMVDDQVQDNRWPPLPNGQV